MDPSNTMAVLRPSNSASLVRRTCGYEQVMAKLAAVSYQEIARQNTGRVKVCDESSIPRHFAATQDIVAAGSTDVVASKTYTIPSRPGPFSQVRLRGPARLGAPRILLPAA